MGHAYAPGNAFNGFGEGFDQGTAMAQGLATQRAGGMLSRGDSTGAANALYRSGQLAAGAGVQDRQAEQQQSEQAARLKWMGQAAEALSQVPDDGQSRQAALSQHVIPTLQAMGIDANTLQSLTSADLSDQSLAMFRQKVDHQYQLIQRRDGSVVAISPQNLQQTTVLEPLPLAQQAQQHMPFGWEMGEDGQPHPIKSVVQGRAQIAAATRAPLRGRSGGGRSSANIPPPPSGWSAR